MRSVKQTHVFKKDFKRESSGIYKMILKEEFWDIVNSLANDIPLPAKYNDHALTGNWKDHRECHIKQDFLFVYMKTDDNKLYLVRLGSHSKLFE